MSNKIKILSVRSSAYIDLGYEDIVGQVMELNGNGHVGFWVEAGDGNRRDIIHYNFEYCNI